MSQDSNNPTNDSDDGFDPYHHWLGIPPEEQPADYYRLLGLVRFEDNPRVIENAADRQMNHVRSQQLTARGRESQQLLNELSLARLCLLNKEKKLAYDAELRVQSQQQLASPAPIDVSPEPEINPLTRRPMLKEHVAPQVGETYESSGPSHIRQPPAPTNYGQHVHAPTNAVRPRHSGWQLMALIVSGFVVLAVFSLGFLLKEFFSGDSAVRSTTATAGKQNAESRDDSQIARSATPAETPQSFDISELNVTGTQIGSASTQVPQESLNSEPRDNSTASSSDRDALDVLSEDNMQGLLNSAIMMFSFENDMLVKNDVTNHPILVTGIGANSMRGELRGNHGVAQGIAGRAFVCNGIDATVRIPDLKPLLAKGEETVTVSLWHRTDKAKLGILFDCGAHSLNGFNLVSLPDGRYRINLNGHNYDSPLTYALNKWRHVGVVFDGTELRLYVDGVPASDWDLKRPKYDAVYSSVGFLGAQSKSFRRDARFYHGLIDEVVVLRQALDEEEIKSLHNWTKSGRVLPTLSAGSGSLP